MPSSPSLKAAVCTGCGLLCNDWSSANQPTDNRCLAAGQWHGGATTAVTTVSGELVNLDDAIKIAVSKLLFSQRTLVTGLLGAPLEAIRVASDIAELLSAAIDGGHTEMAQTTGPTITRAGNVTAAFEELRDRADLVIFWNCDPAITHPRFLERFIEPCPPEVRRKTISLGKASVFSSSPNHRHLPLAGEQLVPTARWLHEAFQKPAVASLPTRTELPIEELREAIQHANCIGFVSSNEADRLGLSSWSLAQLVRCIAHQKPAFQIPLGQGIEAGGPNAAGLVASCTWRFGNPGAIATANRHGSRFEPAEADARRLINRGEVDCLLAVGPLPLHIKEEVEAAPNPPAVIYLTDLAPEPIGSPLIVLAVASLARATAGTMLREDGQLVHITPRETSDIPTLETILTKLADRIKQKLAKEVRQ